MNEEQKQNQSDHEKVDEMYEAIFGDGNGNPGMHKMVTEMYPFYSGTKLGGKAVRNIVTFIASLSVAIYVIVRALQGKNPF